MGITKLNGYRLQRMFIAGANELHENKQAVDAMNVFPVPDGDTGTNMSLTVLAAAKETEKGDALSISEVSKRAASGALRGARGNSGVITSQLFRGFSKGLEGLEEAGVEELTVAMQQAVRMAYKAVMKPKEGTILTVARACAEAALEMKQKTDDVEVFLHGILEHGHRVLNQTPDMLPILKQAGVVDAGGRGLLYILEGGLKHINTEETLFVSDAAKTSRQQEYAALASVENTSITFGYCTEFFIHVQQPDDTTVQQLKSYLATIGDSIVCVSDEEVIKIHVHTDHPGLALEKALTIGSLTGLKIDNMREQHQNSIDFTANAPAVDKETLQAPKEEKPKKEIGFVSISTGDGLTEIFRNLGVDEVIEGGQTMNPSTDDILKAVEKINADHVFILPNNKNIILAAQQAAKLSEDKTLYVIPSKSVPQGISAMLCNDGSTDAEALQTAMLEAIGLVKTATVTYAVRETTIGERQIQQGDLLGILDENIEVVGKDLAESTKELLEKAVDADSEIITIYYGAEVSQADAKQFADEIEERYADCEVDLHKGGQPLYYYIISIE